ncbi:hypothetical protein [Massilia sp. CF038]|uniref:hypothetical protein n=1 Tax=Massilia sp. CF038 TaxID=1881045 RepID=UPI000922E05E|nr:hypothetical protein [Massilia sp. CF038]SHH04266.1 hypothetical protein SAMN05428948_2474 [Massilia sp. CF038]
MSPTPHTHDPAATSPPLSDEADIGSGEKTPAQIETEKMIRDIPPLSPAGNRQQQTPAQSDSGQAPQNRQGQDDDAA